MLLLAKLFQINLRIVSFEEDDDTEISFIPLHVVIRADHSSPSTK